MKEVLVDTSVWINAFNEPSKEDAKALIRLIEDDQKVFIAPVIYQEILQGFDDEKDYLKVKTYLEGFDFVGLENPLADALGAVDIYRLCRKKGSTIRKSNDCLIAWLAIKNNLELLQKDRDFKEIAKHSTLHLFEY